MIEWIGWIILIIISALSVGFSIGIIISVKAISHNATRKLSKDEMARLCALLEKHK
jgi:hypothetical protein